MHEPAHEVCKQWQVDASGVAVWVAATPTDRTQVSEGAGVSVTAWLWSKALDRYQGVGHERGLTTRPVSLARSRHLREQRYIADLYPVRTGD